MMSRVNFLVLLVVFGAHVARGLSRPQPSTLQIFSLQAVSRVVLPFWMATGSEAAHNFPAFDENIKSLKFKERSLQQQDSATPSNSTEESPTIDPNSMNDEPDENSNDDEIQVVVPLNFARGENTDDGIYTPSSTKKEYKPSNGQTQSISWIVGISLVCSISGYIIHRRRQRTRRREYRTHQILREHVEAFDLNFRDEDDLELSNI